MKRFFDRAPILFAGLWILLYIGLPMLLNRLWGPRYGVLAGHLVLAAALLAFLLIFGLAGSFGMTRWAKDQKRLLYLIPLWIVAAGNLWGGVSRETLRSLNPAEVLTMALVGLLEELLFRGLLLRGLERRLGRKTAVILSALLFGLIHGANLLAGQELAATGLQILSAAAWGFLAAMVYCRGGSLLPCILAHALLDITSLFTANGPVLSLVFTGITVLISLAYGLYLAKLPQKTPSP